MKSSCASEYNGENHDVLKAELVQEKKENNDLREIVKNQQLQIDDMAKKIQEVEAGRASHDEEMKKRQAETDALIKRLISMVPTS
jgi:predicted nuclease with TOPRIM domain